MTDPFAWMYEADDRDREIFGEAYLNPTTFPHATDVLVARYVAIGEDGQMSEIYECRMPARFFKLKVFASPSGHKPAWEMSTGSGDEAGALLVSIATAVADGMLGIGRVYCRLCGVRVRLNGSEDGLQSEHACSCPSPTD